MLHAVGRVLERSLQGLNAQRKADAWSGGNWVLVLTGDQRFLELIESFDRGLSKTINARVIAPAYHVHSL
jgi:hypothetical protein